MLIVDGAHVNKIASKFIISYKKEFPEIFINTIGHYLTITLPIVDRMLNDKEKIEAALECD